MPRSRLIYNLFRFFTSLVMVIWVILALRGTHDWTYMLSTTVTFIICIIIVATTLFSGESIAKVYVRLLKWVLQHLHTTEDHRWVIALGITALCDVFLDTLSVIPFIVLSALSMIMICIVADGWDSDRSGMTEGLLIGFGKLLLVHLISLDLLPSILCAAVLALAIASKLTEPAVGEITGNPQHVGCANSAVSPNAGV